VTGLFETVSVGGAIWAGHEICVEFVEFVVCNVLFVLLLILIVELLILIVELVIVVLAVEFVAACANPIPI